MAQAKRMKKTKKKAGQGGTGQRAVAKAATPASANPRGCCLVYSPELGTRELENITRAECDAIANAHPGTVTQWNKGSCA